MEKQPIFFIGTLPVLGDIILAPMDGISDHPFRLLTRRLGSAMSYTEFINGIDLQYSPPHLEDHLRYSDEERPLVYQIFDDSPDRLLQAALKLQKRKPDVIDVNMGCSARTVCGRGAGAGLLKDPKKIASIVSSLSKVLNIPLTVKIRLGWDETQINYLEVAQICEENGAKAIAVHGRLRTQSYDTPANWDPIAEVKQAVSIPVIGNGDIKTAADIDRMKNHTGVDAVMVARAALGNPWIFSRLERSQISVEQVRKTTFEQLGLMTAFYGPNRGSVLMRKFVKKYLAPYNLLPETTQSLMTCPDPDQFSDLLDQVFQSLQQANWAS